MAIWTREITVEAVNKHSSGTLISHVGIEIVEIGEDFLKARMPVDQRTKQPAGVLHGGASVVMAETLASWAATFAVDSSKHHCVGMEINANHVRAAASGYVYGTARPIHMGRSSHIWEVRITDEKDKLVCISRVTMAVLATPNRYGDS